MNYSTYSVLLFCFFALLSFSFSWHINAEWELRKNKDGVKVYTKKIEGSKLKAYKAEVLIKSNAEQALDLLLNFKNYPKWQHNCSTGRLVKKINENSSYVYILTNAPWPVADRDLVLKYDVTRESNGTIMLKMNAKDGIEAAKSGNVRMTYMKGYWKIIPQGDMIKVIHQAHADPAGNIPDWLANSAVVDTPFETLRNMRSSLEN